jgi:hypothetical protein
MNVTLSIPAAFLTEAQAASVRMKGLPLKAWMIREVKAMVVQNRAEVKAEEPDTDASEVDAIAIT